MSIRSRKLVRAALTILVVGAAISYGPVAKYAWPLLILGLIVAIHELGHLLAALAVGIKVHRFAVFVSPSLFEWSWRGIHMEVGSIPIGGFVQAQHAPSDEDEPSAKGCSVEEKRWWQQLIFFGGGIVFNIVSGFLVCVALMATFGKPSLNTPPVVRYVLPGFAAAKAGLLPADRVTHVDGASVETAEKFLAVTRTLTAGQHKLRVIRNDQEVSLTASLLSGEPLGIRFEAGEFERMSLKDSVKQAYLMLANGIQRMGLLVTGNVPVMRAVSGPIGVVSTSSSLVGEGFLGLANLFVILSYGVALSNLLPIPALDGSHIVFALLKAVRLEPSLRAREGLVLVGMVLLLILGLLVAIKDVVALMH